MTHVKNVQAFGKLMGICTGLGGNYNPGNQNLQVNAMTTLSNSAQHILNEVNEAQIAYDYATNKRVDDFAELRKISSRVLSLLKASGAHELTVKDAQRTVVKIWGRREKKPVVLPASPDASVKSPTFAYPYDYASIVQYFAHLVETVASMPKYKPNEQALTVEGLKQRLAELRMVNDAVAQAEVTLSQARRKRNELYYLGESNLFATAMAAKQYVRGAFGYQSPEHLEVRKLRFTKPHA